MARSTPSLAATEAFLAASRHGSFQAAAEEMALSASAFSRRIQTLEAFLGRPLFDRSSGRPQLTPAGLRLKQEIEPALEVITRAMADVRRRAPSRRLRVITSHSLALGWLMPRMGRLYGEHGIDLDLKIGRGAHHLKSGDIDLAIWGGLEDAQGYPRDDLGPMDAAPAAAPNAADGRPAPCGLSALRGERLLRAKNAPNLWPAWLAQVGQDDAGVSYVELETTHFAYESAANGLGVALAVPLLSDRFLRDRRIVPCANARAPVEVRYGLIYAAPALQRRPEVRLFRDWLTREIADSLQVFDQWFRQPCGAGERPARTA
jgi:DNA-binding transcriptional LysR family regulator